ncbi:MAG: HEAT repeat domain-containing protein, partial [Planctomycetota bacterium]
MRIAAASLILLLCAGGCGPTGDKHTDSQGTFTGEPAPPEAKRDPRITPGSHSADSTFRRLRRRGFRVALLGRKKRMLRELVVPSNLRFAPVDERKLIAAVAELHGLKTAWSTDGRTAVLYAGADEEEVRQCLTDLKSPDALTREKAAWRAGWIEDPRVLVPLVAATGDNEAAVVREAERSLRRLGWTAAVALGGEAALDFVARKVLSNVVHLRSDAVKALAFAEGEKALPVLEKALPRFVKTKDRWSFAAGVDAVEVMGSERALRLLKKLDADTPPARSVARLKIASALRGAGDSAAMNDFERRLQDKPSDIQLEDLRHLGEIGRPEAVALLEKALHCHLPSVRQYAVWGLHRAGGPRAAWLIRKAVGDTNPSVRKSAVAALGVGGDKALPLIDSCLRSENPAIRCSALFALADVGGDEALSRLEKTLGDKDRSVRIKAVTAAGRSGCRSALPFLYKALDSEERGVRNEAVKAVGRFGSVEAQPHLKKALDDADSSIRTAALVSLKTVGGPESLTLAARGLTDTSGGVRIEAIRLLERTGGIAAVPLLENAMAHSHSKMRWEAVRWLAYMGGPQALPLVERALEDKDLTIRRLALDSLAKIGGERALPRLEKLLGSEKDTTRCWALEQVAQVGGEKAKALVER